MESSYEKWKANVLNRTKGLHVGLTEKELLDYYNSGVTSSQVYHEQLELNEIYNDQNLPS